MAKVKEAVNKNNARLSSTAHLFERTGVVRFNIKNGDTFDDVWEMAVENGAQDVRPLESDDEGTSLGLEVSVSSQDDGTASFLIFLATLQVICDPSDLHRLTSLFSSPPLSHEIIESETKMVASGPLLQIRDSEEDGAAQEEETSLASTTSWLDEDDMQRLDTLVAALEEGAECHRVWSNVAGWPA
jgi:transcriptional/translational regulatory protein YebC/TACO1